MEIRWARRSSMLAIAIGILAGMVLMLSEAPRGVEGSSLLKQDPYALARSDRDAFQNMVEDVWRTLADAQARGIDRADATVTLRRSVRPAEAKALVDKLEMQLLAWDAKVADGTYHHKSSGDLEKDLEDAIRRVEAGTGQQVTVDDFRIVALYGNVSVNKARSAESDDRIFLIDVRGDDNLSSQGRSKLPPHLFWTFPDWDQR